MEMIEIRREMLKVELMPKPEETEPTTPGSKYGGEDMETYNRDKHGELLKAGDKVRITIEGTVIEDEIRYSPRLWRFKLKDTECVDLGDLNEEDIELIKGSRCDQIYTPDKSAVSFQCELRPGHKGQHKAGSIRWPKTKIKPYGTVSGTRIR